MTALQYIYDGIEKFCGVDLTSSDQHLKISVSRVQRDNDDCKKMVEWFKHYNPFPENSNLISISPGIVGDSRINCHMVLHKISCKCKKGCTGNCSCRKARLFCSVLCFHCWDNCNNRKIQSINSGEDDEDESMLPDHLVQASLSFHVEEDTDYLPKDIGP
ncbi:hypothetical protein AVEN_273132-1 [Araneus ventricosus]|uniref:Tesmin/TSO1-like CXC domain-containing protein n=1 Tax=Araneus ventricosus TaxID=182803 RepID=A0A4Y2KBF7_ARAVE|nr:hypothetical protein AVEN_273132-1 [Araneus ventricosus]